MPGTIYLSFCIDQNFIIIFSNVCSKLTTSTYLSDLPMIPDQIVLRILWFLKRALSGWCVNQIIFFSMHTFFYSICQSFEIWFLCCATAFFFLQKLNTCAICVHIVYVSKTLFCWLFEYYCLHVQCSYFDRFYLEFGEPVSLCSCSSIFVTFSLVLIDRIL